MQSINAEWQCLLHVVGASAAALSSDLEAVRPSSYGEEDLQLQLALAMSKEEHDEEMKRRKGDELKLQMAIEESRKSTDHDVSALHFSVYECLLLIRSNHSFIQ